METTLLSRKARLTLTFDEIQNLQGKKVMLPCCKNNNRYTHTVDVKKISTSIIKHLKSKYYSNDYIKSININKVLSIAYFHDIGHCPYGHAGEEELNSLMSENYDFYYDSFYSGYKHNLLSGKILLDKKMNISWDIIDGVIKHSSTLPKNFNLSRVKSNNLLKLNYIFNCSNTSKENWSWRKFIDIYYPIDKSKEKIEKYNFPCNICKNKRCNFIKTGIISNFYLGYKNCKYSVKLNDNKDTNRNITQYLLFPYPLTIEGDIVRMADEISSLVRDVQHYFSTTIEKNEFHIISEKIKNILHILKSKYGYNTTKEGDIEYKIDIINIINHFGQLILEEDISNKKSIAKDLIDCIISMIQYSSDEVKEISKIDSKQVLWRIHDNHCSPLLYFDDDFDALFNEIKHAIYSIIHTDKIIIGDNNKGREIIRKVFEFYYDNPSIFFYTHHDAEEQLNNITEFINKMKIDGKESTSISKKIEEAKKKHKNDSDSEEYMKLLNAFRREIAFYIASFTEDSLEKFYQEHYCKITRDRI